MKAQFKLGKLRLPKERAAQIIDLFINKISFFFF